MALHAKAQGQPGVGASLSCFFPLSPTETDVTLAGGEKNHSARILMPTLGLI